MRHVPQHETSCLHLCTGKSTAPTEKGSCILQQRFYLLHYSSYKCPPCILSFHLITSPHTSIEMRIDFANDRVYEEIDACALQRAAWFIGRLNEVARMGVCEELCYNC